MSVRKRNWTTAVGEERSAWVLDYKDREGKRRSETFDRKKEADARAAEIAVDIKAGVHVPRSASIDVATAGEHWIASVEAVGRERGTIAGYRLHLRKHINPFIGRVKLADLTGPHVASFKRDLAKAGVKVATQRKVLGSLVMLLGNAVREGAINRNVADTYQIKQDKRSKRKLKVGVDIPTPEEIGAFVRALQGSDWRPLFVTAVFTGMRASELRGLRWVNVELPKTGNGAIRVRERADIYHTMGSPKSEDSERTIPIDPFVVNMLREWKLRSPKGELGLVFPTNNGNVQSLANIRKRGLIPLMKKAGIVDADGNAKYSGMHALRHWYASWLINSKADGGLGLQPMQVQARLGHATLALTTDTYSHLFPQGDDEGSLEAGVLRIVG
jgi:integrase